MDRLTVELSALGFQAVLTVALGLVYLRLWQQQRRRWFATWALAWGLYAARLGLISAFIVTRNEAWLLGHQMATSLVALLLLLAALQFSRGVRWPIAFAWLALAGIAWAWVALEVIRNYAVAGTSSVVLLSSVTLWTGAVFWRHWRDVRNTGAAILAFTFVLWGLHHLDYPLLRPLGAGVLFGVFADVLFIVAAAVGTLFLVNAESRRALEARNAQLEQLTRLLLRAQEDERRRIARELHDEAGQVLTAVKIELDLEGRTEASEMVARALAQVRDVTNLLRPPVLDDLGLEPALRGLVDDFARRTRIEAALDTSGGVPPLAPAHEVTVYRVVQEALTNVARHSGARTVQVRLADEGETLRLTVEDDGRGVAGEPAANLGLLGMRERVTAAGGTLALGARRGGGFRVEAVLPHGGAA
jgi:signal transduction histidine kinase